MLLKKNFLRYYIDSLWAVAIACIIGMQNYEAANARITTNATIFIIFGDIINDFTATAD